MKNLLSVPYNKGIYKATLYQNDTILSIVQVSNFIFVLWILITAFYYLYKYFKKKYD